MELRRKEKFFFVNSYSSNEFEKFLIKFKQFLINKISQKQLLFHEFISRSNEVPPQDPFRELVRRMGIRRN